MAPLPGLPGSVSARMSSDQHFWWRKSTNIFKRGDCFVWYFILNKILNNYFYCIFSKKLNHFDSYTFKNISALLSWPCIASIGQTPSFLLTIYKIENCNVCSELSVTLSERERLLVQSPDMPLTCDSKLKCDKTVILGKQLLRLRHAHAPLWHPL